MSKKFPTDAPKRKVIQSLEILGFRIVREREHIAMIRKNHDGSTTPLTMPNHPRIKASTLELSVLKQASHGTSFSKPMTKYNLPSVENFSKT
jgi:predicted RNA binding protein YcfA (HicA-like mRNA interferase family)